MKALRVGLFRLAACFYPVVSAPDHRSPVWTVRTLNRPPAKNNNIGLFEDEETRALFRHIMGLESVGLYLALSLSMPMLSLSLPMLSLSLPAGPPIREIKLPPQNAPTAPPLREPTESSMTHTPSKRVVIPPTMSPTPHDRGESAPKALGSVEKRSGSGTRPAAVTGIAILASAVMVVVVVAAALYLFHRHRTSHMTAAASSGSVASGSDENSITHSNEGAV